MQKMKADVKITLIGQYEYLLMNIGGPQGGKQSSADCDEQ